MLPEDSAPIFYLVIPSFLALVLAALYLTSEGLSVVEKVEEHKMDSLGYGTQKRLMLPFGRSKKIEAVISVAPEDSPYAKACVVITHPHSMLGGDMNNNV